MRKRKSREKIWFGEGDHKKNFAEEGWLIINKRVEIFLKIGGEGGGLTRKG